MEKHSAPKSGSAANELGTYVHQLRLKHGLSLRVLAAQAAVDFSWLAKLERGSYSTPDPRSLSRLARALGIEVEDLYLEAGYTDAHHLPGLAPYLRAKYDLPD